jgi:hypothetical protein
MKGETETAANNDQRIQLLLGIMPEPCTTLLHWLMAGIGSGGVGNSTRAGEIAADLCTPPQSFPRAEILPAPSANTAVAVLQSSDVCNHTF